LGGDLVFDFEDLRISGRVAGRARVAIFSVGFKFDYTHKFEVP